MTRLLCLVFRRRLAATATRSTQTWVMNQRTLYQMRGVVTMGRRYTVQNSNPHPLESVAREAFKEREAHDRVTLGMFLGGNCLPRGGDSAYLKVAEDVLGYMESQGKIERDSLGWCRLAKS